MINRQETFNNISNEVKTSENWKAIYTTYVRIDEGWTYAGNCFRGQYKNMN